MKYKFLRGCSAKGAWESVLIAYGRILLVLFKHEIREINPILTVWTSFKEHESMSWCCICCNVVSWIREIAAPVPAKTLVIMLLTETLIDDQ